MSPALIVPASAAGCSFTTSPGIRFRSSSHGRSHRVATWFRTCTAASFQTPHGAVGESDAASGFTSRSIDLGHKFAKYTFVRRLRDEVRYGIRFCRVARREHPDVVISANTPLVAALVIQIYLLVRRVPVVFWQQDIYSMAMREHLTRRGGAIGSLVGALLSRSRSSWRARAAGSW